MRALLLLALTGCISPRTVPAPAQPVAIVPRTLKSDQGPAPKGAGTLVLDVTGRSAHVFAIQNPNTPEETDVRLCDTPCAVNLLEGKHFLRFVGADDDHLTGIAEVEVKSGRTLVRHALGYERPMASGVGFAGLLLGGAGLVVAIVGTVTLASASGTEKQSNTIVGGIMMPTGIVSFASAWTLLHFGRTERQPGATTIVKLSD